MLELWQTEWCPASSRIRQRLTQLGVDYVTRQVPVEQRTAMRFGARPPRAPSPPSSSRRTAFVGEHAICAYLDRNVAEPSDAEAHRLKAAKARRRYLEEECKCPPAPTP